MMIRKPKKPSLTLVLLMVLLSILGLAFARMYYTDKNALADPRVTPARELYQDYNRFAGAGQYDSVLHLMDRIEEIYAAYPHYRDGYETAVLYNNRSAAYLSKMMVAAEEGLPADSALFLEQAEENIRKALNLYSEWKKTMKPFDSRLDKLEFQLTFARGPRELQPENLLRYYHGRLEELEEALEEYPRRLSVSLTNLGMIQRYRQDYDSAARCFKEAVGLWEENLTAKNNLNVLLGQPLEKRSTLEKLFPPEK